MNEKNKMTNVRQLKEDINTAIAWGVPDNESTGMSAHEFTSLLRKSSRYIIQLENMVKELEEEKMNLIHIINSSNKN